MNWLRFWSQLREEAGEGTDAGGSAAPTDTGSTAAEPSAASHFDDVVNDFLGVEPVAKALAPPTTVVAAPPTATATAAVPGQSAAPSPTAPVVATPAAVPLAQPQAATTMPNSPQSPALPQPQGDPQQRWQAARTAAMGDFERSLSNFSEQDVVTLMTEPHKILPKFGAELGMAVFDMSIKSIMAMLPQVIAAQQRHNKDEEAAHEQFYGMYPQLRQHPQGIETLYRVGPAYNNANNGRPIDAPTRMREIGEIVCRSLGIDSSPANVQAAATAIAPTAPTPSTLSPVPILPPPVPAGLGGAAAPPSTSHYDWDDILHLRRA